MLPEVVARLECVVCRGGLAADGGGLVCAAGHRFDLARQGYVNLLSGGARTGTADTADMVAARDTVQRAGLYDPIADALSDAVTARLRPSPAGTSPDTAPGTVLGATSDTAAVAPDAVTAGPTDVRTPFVVDLGAGTGHYAARVLDAAPDAVGLALDLSKYAARRAARAHPRLAAAVADTWARLPLRDHAADVALTVFAPRNGPETARVLRPGGLLAVVVPAADHLTEAVDALGLLTVHDDKTDTVRRALEQWFTPSGTSDVRYQRALDRDTLRGLVRMGPSAWHVDDDTLDLRLAGINERFTVTFAVRVLCFTSVLRKAQTD